MNILLIKLGELIDKESRRADFFLLLLYCIATTDSNVKSTYFFWGMILSYASLQYNNIPVLLSDCVGSNHVQTHTDLYTDTYKHLRMHSLSHTHTKCRHTHARTHARTHVHTHTHTRMHACVRACTRITFLCILAQSCVTVL